MQRVDRAGEVVARHGRHVTRQQHAPRQLRLEQMIDQACHRAAHLAGLHRLLGSAGEALLPLHLERLAFIIAQRCGHRIAALTRLTLALLLVGL